MRKTMIATLFAAAAALAGMSAGSAAPVNGTVLKQAGTTTNPTVQVQYYYHRHRCHGYYSHWHWC